MVKYSLDAFKNFAEQNTQEAYAAFQESLSLDKLKHHKKSKKITCVATTKLFEGLEKGSYAITIKYNKEHLKHPEKLLKKKHLKKIECKPNGAVQKFFKKEHVTKKDQKNIRDFVRISVIAKAKASMQ